MDPVDGAREFEVSGAAYDAFMGRYARPLAPLLADWAGVGPGRCALDVGCGPGALTEVLVQRLGVGRVRACDPSAPFVAACRRRHPGLEVTRARAEALPYADDTQDLVLAQLVLHFVSDPETAAREMRRVLRPGGTVAVCSWDVARGMEMLRHFWDAALRLDPAAPDQARLRFGGAGEVSDLLAGAGFEDAAETTLEVATTYRSFDELWSGFLAGVGPAGGYTTRQEPARREELRQALFEEVGSPAGAFELGAVARAGRAVAPG